MTNSDLAILGGSPVRTQPFSVEPMVGSEEEAAVLAALRAMDFSRYIGSTLDDIETVLRLTSAEAANIDAPWHFLGGPNVRAFAAEFAQRFDVPYAVPVNSATTGLSVALAAAGVGPGDEVIVPAISYTATGTAPLLFNSIPVFVDVDATSFCMDPKAVEAALSPRTRAILPVHLVGNLADMEALCDLASRHNLVVIEDAAQAIGATWRGRPAGTIGRAGVFSFQQSKNIMTGEGGMIVTADAEIARRCRLIVNHGEVVFDDRHTPDELVNTIGFNFRMPELCAAVGRAQLAKLDRVNAWRTRNAEVLREGLRGVPGIHVPWAPSADDQPVPHLLVALYDEQTMGFPRTVFVAALRAEGIPVGTGYVRPMYANPHFLQRVAFGRDGCPWTCRRGEGSASTVRYEHGMCPNAERLLEEKFLWFYHIAHSSTVDDMRDVVMAVRKVVEGRSDLAGLSPSAVGTAGASGQGRILDRASRTGKQP